MGASYLVQLAVFAGISIVLIPLTRPLAKKITKPSPQAVNVDAMVGRSGLVTKKIDPDADSGQVRIDGQVWQARAEIAIDEGVRIKVERVTGAKLHVTKLENSQT
jgi:membrane protein implicated in regulation of membrane protease activity